MCSSDLDVCASNHAHLYSRSTSKTVPRRQGLPPASVCSTLGCVNFSARTALFSRHVKDRATTAGLAPASVCSTLRCVHSTAHTSLFSLHIKDGDTVAGLAPASVCSTLSCVHFIAHAFLFSQHVKDSATTAGLLGECFGETNLTCTIFQKKAFRPGRTPSIASLAG